MGKKDHISAFDQARRRWHHLSVSTIQAFKDCERIPFFDKILKLPRKERAAARLGTEIHKQPEHYVKTGQDIFGPRAAPLKQYIRPRNPGELIFCEYGLDGREHAKDDPFDYDRSILKIDGVPLEGYIDRIEFLEGVVLEDDYKSTSDIEQWAKTAAQLKTDVQLIGYAEAGFRWHPQATEIRSRHLYVQTAKAIKVQPVPVTFTRAEVDKGWAEIERLGRGVLALAAHETEKEIPRTGQAHGMCSKYGGCHFALRCLESPLAMMRARIQTTAARNLLRQFASEEGQQTPQGDPHMSIVARQLKLQQAAPPLASNQAPAEAPPATPAPVTTQTAVPVVPKREAFGEDDPAVKAMLPTGGSVQVLPDGSRLLFNSAGVPVGTLPPLVGTVKIQDVAPTAAEIEKAKAVGIVPPDAPKNDANAKVEEKKPKRVKRSDTSATQASTAPLPTTAAPAVSETSPQPSPSPAAGQAKSAPGASVTEPSSSTGTKAGDLGKATVGGIQIFVDCIPLGQPYEMLNGYVARQAEALAKASSVEDIRLTDSGAVKGRGALAGLIREDPPPPGIYVAIGAYADLMSTALEALIPMASLVVKGVR